MQSGPDADPTAHAPEGRGDATRSLRQRRRFKYALALLVGTLVLVGGFVAIERWLASKQAQRDRVKSGIARTVLVWAFAIAVASGVVAVLIE